MFTEAAFMSAELALDLELTAAKENVGRFYIPVDDGSCVQKLGRRHELSDALGGPRLVNDAILPSTHAIAAETYSLWRLRTDYRRVYPRKQGSRQMTRSVLRGMYWLGCLPSVPTTNSRCNFWRQDFMA